jgi:hypothetical protein
MTAQVKHFEGCICRCYNISSMPWYQRKIASAVFATPPTSSFEEALIYFSKAEEVEPNFYR